MKYNYMEDAKLVGEHEYGGCWYENDIPDIKIMLQLYADYKP